MKLLTKYWVSTRAPLICLAYVATIPVANLMITHLGMVPVGFGLLAPAGVYAVGAALVLRDWAREEAGRSVVVVAITVGTALSFLLTEPRLALASATAFLLSESLDFAVYEPLRKRGRPLAMGVSNVVGIAADSLLFLWLAFGSLAYLPGQLVGKAWVTVVALALIALRAQRRQAQAS